jgi:hypothetical protein
LKRLFFLQEQLVPKDFLAGTAGANSFLVGTAGANSFSCRNSRCEYFFLQEQPVLQTGWTF